MPQNNLSDSPNGEKNNRPPGEIALIVIGIVIMIFFTSCLGLTNSLVRETTTGEQNSTPPAFEGAVDDTPFP